MTSVASKAVARGCAAGLVSLCVSTCFAAGTQPAALASLLAVGTAAKDPANPFASPPDDRPDINVLTPTTAAFAQVSGSTEMIVGGQYTLHLTPAAWPRINQIERIRLFRLWPDGTPSFYKVFGDCEVFFTTLLTFERRVRDAQAVLVVTAPPRAALDLDARKRTVMPAKWMAVIETNTTPGMSDGILRLRQSSKKTYFRGGFVITLKPDKTAYSDAEFDAAAAGQATPAEILRKLELQDRSVVCHIASSTEIAGDAGSTKLVACNDGDAAESPF